MERAGVWSQRSDKKPCFSIPGASDADSSCFRGSRHCCPNPGPRLRVTFWVSLDKIAH